MAWSLWRQAQKKRGGEREKQRDRQRNREGEGERAGRQVERKGNGR